MLLLIFLSVIASSSSTEDPLAEHRCTIWGEEGFRCLKGGGCIPMQWVCDEEVQCKLPDTSDEDFGCDLYHETGCKSIHGERYFKCPDSDQCVKDLSDCSIVTPGEGGGNAGETANHFCDNPQGDPGGEGFRDGDKTCMIERLCMSHETRSPIMKLHKNKENFSTTVLKISPAGQQYN